jgi:hypothetical protein
MTNGSVNDAENKEAQGPISSPAATYLIAYFLKRFWSFGRD